MFHKRPLLQQTVTMKYSISSFSLVFTSSFIFFTRTDFWISTIFQHWIWANFAFIWDLQPSSTEVILKLNICTPDYDRSIIAYCTRAFLDKTLFIRILKAKTNMMAHSFFLNLKKKPNQKQKFHGLLFKNSFYGF